MDNVQAFESADVGVLSTWSRRQGNSSDSGHLEATGLTVWWTSLMHHHVAMKELLKQDLCVEFVIICV